MPWLNKDLSLRDSFEALTLALVTVFVSGGLTSLYLKIFNMAPPLPGQVANLPVLMMMLVVIVMNFRAAVFGAFANIPAVLLAVLAVISVLWSLDSAVTIREAIFFVLTLVYFGAVAWSRSWREMIGPIWASMLAMVLFSFVLYIAVPSFGKMTDPFPGAMMGLWLEKNTAGQIGTFGALLALARFAVTPKTAVTSGISFIIFTAFLLATTSKTSLFAFLLGVSAFGWVFLMRRQFIFSTVIGWATVFIGGLGANFIMNNQEAILKLAGRSATFTGRADIWKALQVSTADRPLLGHGYAAYWNELYTASTLPWVKEELKYYPNHAHNSWLEIRLALGQVGTVILWVLLGYAIIVSLLRIRGSNGTYFAVPFLASACVVASFESILAYPNNYGGAFLLLIAAKAIRPPVPGEQQSGLSSVLSMFQSPNGAPRTYGKHYA